VHRWYDLEVKATYAKILKGIKNMCRGLNLYACLVMDWLLMITWATLLKWDKTWLGKGKEEKLEKERMKMTLCSNDFINIA
jgi:hypothetical protein